ncbi:MAG: hypothetical protein WBD20_23640 [Pirellulaceae bacterium]
MTTSLKSVAQAHADHRYWQSDLDMWAEDVVYWKGEQADALQELQQIAAEIREHGKALDDHNEKIVTLGTGLHAHEKELAAFMQTGVEGGMHEEFGSYHDRHAADHAQQRQAHERIKKHHHRAMAQVAILKAAMEAAM